MQRFFFYTLWLFIAVVSAYDGYLNLRYPVTVENEENPIAQCILRATGNDAPLLISLKFLGTSVCLAFLLSCYVRKKQLAWVITSSLVVVQGAVLIYLTDGLLFFR
jgi:hypothetical protein